MKIIPCFLLLLAACDWEKGYEESNFGNTSFTIVNSDYKNVIGAEGEPYHPDTIQVFNQEWVVQPLRKEYIDWQGVGWVFDLNYLEGRVPAETNFRNLDKTFYLYLDQQDVDTIRVFGRPDSVFVNGKKLKGAPNSQVAQYTSFFYIKD